VVVALDLEGDRLALAEVDHARVLARPLKDALTYGGKALQQQRRVLVPAVLGPEEREHRELEVVRVTTEELPDTPVLEVGEAERPVQRLFCDGAQVFESSQAA
jgi:hypothetical protein